MNIENLNSENYKQFIDKYGTIKDSDLAKESLIINPNSWLVLDDELKKRGDVIAHYVPIGYYKDSVWVDQAVDMYELEYFDLLLPEGFTCDCGFLNFRKEKIVPNIIWPEDFSKEQYLQILSSIPIMEAGVVSNYWYNIDRETPDTFKNSKMYSIYNIKHDENKRIEQGPDTIDRKCFAFDRSKIKEAVDNFYNNLDKPKQR